MIWLDEKIYMSGISRTSGQPLVIRIDGYNETAMYCTSFTLWGEETHRFSIEHRHAQRAYLDPQQQAEFIPRPQWEDDNAEV